MGGVTVRISTAQARHAKNICPPSIGVEQIVIKVFVIEPIFTVGPIVRIIGKVYHHAGFGHTGSEGSGHRRRRGTAGDRRGRCAMLFFVEQVKELREADTEDEQRDQPKISVQVCYNKHLLSSELVEDRKTFQKRLYIAKVNETYRPSG